MSAECHPNLRRGGHEIFGGLHFFQPQRRRMSLWLLILIIVILVLLLGGFGYGRRV
jgi:hypothetical protein